jgi:hypothetical protein
MKSALVTAAFSAPCLAPFGATASDLPARFVLIRLIGRTAELAWSSLCTIN